MSKGVLDGLRVVNSARCWPGPSRRNLRRPRAEVIKVEKPDGGDDARQMGAAFRHGDALNFHEFNRGKKSVTLDLKSAEVSRRCMRCSNTPTSCCTICAPAWPRRWASVPMT